jgi:DNA modification methylase
MDKNIKNKVQDKLKIVYVPISSLRHAEYNPRIINDITKKPVRESVLKHGPKEPLIVNKAPGREGVIISGNLRYEVMKDLGYNEVPVIFVYITDLEREKDLCLQLNKAVGEWDLNLLAEFDEKFLVSLGWSSEELDEIFPAEENVETFDLAKELKKLSIDKIRVKKGDVYDLNGSRVMCGDSCIPEDMDKLMGAERADLCLTDPPYLLSYLTGKSRGKDGPTVGFGVKKNRRYLETESLPDNFTDLWMATVAKFQKPDFSIIIFENPKNLKTIWTALEKYWKYRNTITWHIPNRVQGFSAKYKFFNKQDIALVGTKGKVKLNLEPEPDELFQNEYENALFATAGKPTWEGYEKGKKICPTDFIEHVAADEKSSGQGVIFGTKPLELLIPYIKVLTQRGDLVLDPFGGSFSTGIAAIKLGRRCFAMEKSAVYTEIILNRWSKLTGLKPKKICEGKK